ncbi:hypothetical protein LMG22931_06887 [Paraburkholderia nemoris]|jgi:hypothetical protein|nr:hypothetical protein LMG22931_06887 [Paraburkholderia nemoris]
MLLPRSFNLAAGVACALLLASANAFSQPCATADDRASLLQFSTHDDDVRAERHREEQLRSERLREVRLREGESSLHCDGPVQRATSTHG